MIVQESDILLAALDRRLQVDRVLALDPLAAVRRSSEAPQSPRSQAAAAPSDPSPNNLATRLPLGQVIIARVVEVPQPGHVIADFGSLRIAMDWPAGTGAVPQPGRDIALRVLAHQPMLLFQSADVVDGRPAAAPGPWSSDALSLQPRGAAATRFDIPILAILAIVPQAAANEEAAPHAARSIALDDVIVAHHAAVVDDVTALVPKMSDEPLQRPPPFMPLVLQGPAWPGQPMEFVIHRERADEQLDNPVLDQWCGELVIDLPHLGRVAGHLAFSMQGLRIRLEGDDADTVAAMTAASAELAGGLAAVDLRIATLSVGMPAADASRPDPLGARATSGVDDRG